VSQEESEHNEVDGMKKGVDSKGEVMHSLSIKNPPGKDTGVVREGHGLGVIQSHWK